MIVSLDKDFSLLKSLKEIRKLKAAKYWRKKERNALVLCLGVRKRMQIEHNTSQQQLLPPKCWFQVPEHLLRLVTNTSANQKPVLVCSDQ